MPLYAVDAYTGIRALKATSGADGHVVHHNIDTVSGVVSIQGEIGITGQAIPIAYSTGVLEITGSLSSVDSIVNPIPIAYSTGAVIISDGGSSISVDGSVEITGDPVNITGNLSSVSTITNPVPIAYSTGAVIISDGGDSITVDGSLSADLTGEITIGTVTGEVSINDGGNSITVDGSLTSIDSITNPVTVNALSGNFNITGGNVIISDGGSSVTVDGSVSLLGDSSVTGRVSTVGDVAVTGSLSSVDTITNPVPIAYSTGLVQVSDGGGSISIDDGGGSITVDGSFVGNLTGDLSGTFDGGIALRTDTLYNGETPLVPKFAAINATGNGDNTLVAGVPTKKVRVLSLFAIASNDVTGTIQSSTTGAIAGPLTLSNVYGFVLNYNPNGWFQTATGELLNLNLSSAVQVGGSLSYIEVPS